MRALNESVFAVGAIDWDATFFDKLVPLPDGTSYNSYLVKGSEKVALLDTVDAPMADILMRNLVELGVDRVDYIIAHHAEQDHSGALPDMLLLYPDAKVVTNPKCKEFLLEMVDVEEDKFITVEDGETLSLGDKTLEFVYLPWVHWPETMGTYLQEDKILFSCDFLGSHLATSDLFVEDRCLVQEAAKRYYAEIMMPFRRFINKNLEKLSGYEIDMIAPSHGPVYREPDVILDSYKKWASDSVENEVVVAYISMHGSTAKAVRYFVNALMHRGVKVRQIELSTVDVGKLTMPLVDAATLVIASPMVLAGAHPNAAYAAFLVNALRPKFRHMSMISSYAWGGRVVDQLTGMMPNIKAELLEPVLLKGDPDDVAYLALDRLADEIKLKHDEL